MPTEQIASADCEIPRTWEQPGLANLCVSAEAEQKPQHGSRLPFMRSSMYPRYYQNDFHFQTDGWFSSHSARRYDASTETLFMGRQDAMQRTTLIPIARCAARSYPAALAYIFLRAQPNKFTQDSVVRSRGCN